MGQTAGAIGKAIAEVGIDTQLVELAYVRASQINGCAACLSVHVPEALKAGVSQEKLAVLPAWREIDVFSQKERAALDLAEELTSLPSLQRNGDAVVRALEVFTDEEVAALEWAIILINTYNRISIASGHPPVNKI